MKIEAHHQILQLKDLPLANSTSDLSRDKKSDTTPLTEKSKQVVDSPSEYPPQDQPETPIDSEEGLEEPSSKRSQKVPTDDPFSKIKRDIDG